MHIHLRVPEVHLTLTGQLISSWMQSPIRRRWSLLSGHRPGGRRQPVCMRAFSFKDHFENSDRRELAGVGFLAVRYLTIITSPDHACPRAKPKSLHTIHAVRPYLKLYSRAIATQRIGPGRRARASRGRSCVLRSSRPMS